MGKTALQLSAKESELSAYSRAGVIPINTTLLQWDCSYLRTFDIQVASIGTTGVVTPQMSMDGGVTWNAVAMVNQNTGAATTTLTSGALHRYIAAGGLFRLQLTTATTAGTTTINVAANRGCIPYPAVNQTVNLTQISGAANSSGGATGGLGVGGFAGHSATASGNPIQVGGVVATAVETTLVSGDQCRVAMSTNQQLVTVEGAVPDLSWAYAAAAGGIVNTTDVAIAAARGASIRNYLKAIQIKNAHATVATEVVIKDGATIIWRGHVAAAMNSSDVFEFEPPLRGTANTAMNVACITTGAQVYCSAQGYQGS
jgi:hypothetical protein